MEMKIIEDKRNLLMNRREIELEVTHPKSGTPDRFTIRKALASKAGSKLENVYVLDIRSTTGMNKSLCRADVYESPQAAQEVLPKHVLARNMSPEEKAKTEQVKKEKRPEEKKAKKKAEKAPPEKPSKEAKKGK